MTLSSKAVQRADLHFTLPAIEHDETLYSWCAAVHASVGNTSSVSTSLALFGNSHSPRQHDIPRGLLALQHLLSDFSENPVELLRAHTVAACYLPFISASNMTLVAADIGCDIKPHWRRSLLSPSRSRPITHPLKFCGKCCTEDTATTGRAYWHTNHQLPASWICSLHFEPLTIVSGHPRRWLLPSLKLDKCAAIRELDAAVANIAAAVGSAISKLKVVSTDSLRYSALKRLRNIGVIHSLAGARHDRLATWFSNSPMGRMCAADYSGMSALADGNWVPAHLWRKKCDHPARWIVLWSALQWRDMDEACEALVEACSDTLRSDRGQYLLFPSQEQLLRAPDYVYAAFATCESYEAVMTRLHVNRSDVVRWLESDLELRQTWKRINHSRRIQSTEQRLRKSMIEWISSTSSLEGFLENNGADVRWLAKNAPSSHRALLGKLHRRGTIERSLF